MGHRFYERKHKCAYLVNLTAVNGSVFPSAFMISFPCGIVSAILVFIFREFPANEEVNESILTNSAIWSSFSFIIGFLVVFRTSHAFNRFWEALTSTHKMGAEWFDACSALISFSKGSTVDSELIQNFHNKVIRLFSMMHACAIAELEDMDRGEDADAYMPRSFQVLELLDARAFDDQTLFSIRESDCRVELIYQWIQHLIVENSQNGVLSVAPPILTRAFQELSTGMVCFNDAMKIADTPFPFPYAQTCDALLFVQYICTPLIVATYVNHWAWAFLFCFVYIFSFWALTLTGLELEFPYGKDANDIDTEELQKSMNHKLQLLVTRPAWTPPKLQEASKEQQRVLIKRICAAEESLKSTFSELWFDLGASELTEEHANSVKRRFTANPSNSGPVKAYTDARCDHEGSIGSLKESKSEPKMNREGSRETPGSQPRVGQRLSAKVFGSISTEGDEIRSRGSHKNRARPVPNRLQHAQSYVLEGDAALQVMVACQSKSSKDSMNTADGGAVMGGRISAAMSPQCSDGQKHVADGIVATSLADDVSKRNSFVSALTPEHPSATAEGAFAVVPGASSSQQGATLTSL